MPKYFDDKEKEGEAASRLLAFDGGETDEKMATVEEGRTTTTTTTTTTSPHNSTSSRFPYYSPFQIFQRTTQVILTGIILMQIYFASNATPLTSYADALNPISLFKPTLAGRFIPNMGSSIPWSTCTDHTDTLCAFLPVPMDYANPKANETVSLALRMIPASAPLKDRMGTILSNPGGPGGSGTQFILRKGFDLSTIVDGRYNILSWDPRGVNLTGPSLTCFQSEGDSNRFARDIEHLGLPYETRYGTENSYFNTTTKVKTQEDEDGKFIKENTTKKKKEKNHWSNIIQKNYFVKLFSFQDSLIAACESSTDLKSKLILEYSSTPYVVRDMKSIMEALGEKEINYWGFSYGTILGATFSAMFPSLAHRVVLDGVSDSVSYMNDLKEWGRSGMTDNGLCYQGFLDSCIESGPSGCDLVSSSSSTSFSSSSSSYSSSSSGPMNQNNKKESNKLRERINTLLEKLKDHPVAVGHSVMGPGIVTSSDVIYAIFHALYAPISWPSLASALAELEKGNGTLMYEAANANNGHLGRKNPIKNEFHRSMMSDAANTAAILCSDTDISTLSDVDLDSFSSYSESLGQMSPSGEIWAAFTSQCRKWPFKAKEVYRGPWTRKDGLKKTKFPVLFVSMTADPVTPLKAARSMSEGFGKDSASLLIQNGFGHCSLAQPSTCTAKAIRSYFLDGKVPVYGEICDSDPGYLFPNSSSIAAAQVRAKDRELNLASWYKPKREIIDIKIQIKLEEVLSRLANEVPRFVF